MPVASEKSQNSNVTILARNQESIKRDSMSLQENLNMKIVKSGSVFSIYDSVIPTLSVGTMVSFSIRRIKVQYCSNNFGGKKPKWLSDNVTFSAALT